MGEASSDDVLRINDALSEAQNNQDVLSSTGSPALSLQQVPPIDTIHNLQENLSGDNMAFSMSSSGYISAPALGLAAQSVQETSSVQSFDVPHRTREQHVRNNQPIDINRNSSRRNGPLAGHASAENLLRQFNMNIISNPSLNTPINSRNPVHSWTMTTSDLLIDGVIRTEQNLHDTFREQLSSFSPGSSIHGENSSAIPRQGRLRSFLQNLNISRSEEIHNSRVNSISNRFDIEEDERDHIDTVAALEMSRIGARRRSNELPYTGYNRNQRAFSDSFIHEYQVTQSYEESHINREHSQSLSLSDSHPEGRRTFEGNEHITTVLPDETGSNQSNAAGDTAQQTVGLDPSLYERENVTRESQESRERRIERASRWIRVNHCINCTITMVALIFPLLLFLILVCWVVLTSAYVVSIDKPCDVPLKFYYWFATFQLILDIFRGDIMRVLFCHEPNDYLRQRPPRRIVIYNTIYLIFAMVVLYTGVRSVFIGHSTCSNTAPELFQTSKVFIVLSISAWISVLFVYLLPFFFIAIFLTRHGYLPPSTLRDRDLVLRGNIFSRNQNAPPHCIEYLRDIKIEDFPSSYPNECCICMVDFASEDDIVGTPCEHVFHKSCCREWLRQARSCPVCRTDLPIALGLTEQDTRQQLNDEGRGRPPTVNDENLTGEGVQQDIIQFFRNWNFESENPTLNVEAV